VILRGRGPHHHPAASWRAIRVAPMLTDAARHLPKPPRRARQPWRRAGVFLLLGPATWTLACFPAGAAHPGSRTASALRHRPGRAAPGSLARYRYSNALDAAACEACPCAGAANQHCATECLQRCCAGKRSFAVPVSAGRFRRNGRGRAGSSISPSPPSCHTTPRGRSGL
jgi:hypothetical protein